MKKSAKIDLPSPSRAKASLCSKKDTRFTLNLATEVKELLYREALSKGKTASEIVYALILDHQKNLPPEFKTPN